MKFFKKKSLFALLIVIGIILPIYSAFTNPKINNFQKDESLQIYPQAINRTGKIFSEITATSKDCYINRDQPKLNEQPSLLIPGYNISYARMQFENISAINYTRSIESEFSEFISSSENGPTYIYQKFAVEMNQYVNNVSILIQDFRDPTSSADENKWEVSIVNCLNDIDGTPNPYLNGTLGSLKKLSIPYSTHWEHFDFKNDGAGPIYLNITNTKMTLENGIEKYWFAIKIKIPPTEIVSGYPLTKFLYFNPDNDNRGEGDTYAVSPDFYYDAYTINNVNVSKVINGTLLASTPDSFKFIDEDRYLVQNGTNLVIDLKFYLQELKNSPYTYHQLKLFHNLLNWQFDHYKYIFSFDFYLMVNVSHMDRIEDSTLYIYNHSATILQDPWFALDYDIKQASETLIYFSARTPWDKYQILEFMDTGPTKNNTLRFKLEYIGNNSGNYNVSINQFKIEVGEIENLDTIQKHDPLVQELSFPTNVNIINGSTGSFGEEAIESLKYIDDDYYEAQALSNNLTFILTFNVLNDLNSSLWDVDYFDWLVSYPNPIVPQMDIRISSNVSKPDNLGIAALALYKGNTTFDILRDEENRANWIILSDFLEFAHENETTSILRFDAGFTWIFLNLLNESRNNEVNFVLLYITKSPSDYGFNVSINEFSINFYIQNAISSDISSSIGLGINSNSLTPSDLGLQNFGIDIVDTGIGSGIWEGEIDNAVIDQGFFEFNVTSLWHAVRFDVNGTYERFKIDPVLEFVEIPASQYMKGITYMEVRISEAGGKPLEGVDIIFEVLNPGGTPLYDTTSISNNEGIATATLQLTSTGSGYSIRVRFAESGFYAAKEIQSGAIRVVDEFMLFMDNFMRFLPYIIIGAVAIASIVTVRQIRRSRLRKFWAGEAKTLDDLVKISYIMIIHKDVGVSIFNKQISLEGIDSDLISGFLQAISQFRTEIKKDSAAAKGQEFEMDYGDFKIVIADGEFVRVALILDGTPSEKLKESQWLFTEQFEKRFSSLLVNFTGDITPFREAEDMIENYFNITLVYPLQLGKHYGVVKLKGLEKALVEVAEQIQKERNFFFISSLINFVLAGTKKSRDEIITTIIELKRKGLIIPVHVE
ncbi:MAG: hypothetical protein ACFE9N_14870 [Promethearchaeota archaeon]